MVIRQRQMEFLTVAAAAKFEHRMAEHLNRCFPDECHALGETGVREIIHYGIERAATYGFDLERDVCKYIDLVIAFGRDFDCDPELPWASRILEDEEFHNTSAKMESLFDTAKLHLA